jgi:hypothetical protein
LKPREHALFASHPLQGSVQLSIGPAPTPYQVYDGHGVFIGGTADLQAMRELLAPEQVVPVQTSAGHALMAVWAFDFKDASLGPHHELQISAFVSQKPLPPVPAHRLGLLELMLTRPDVQMLCHGLWNSTPPVVAYNRELLALDARQSHSRVVRAQRAVSFDVQDAATGRPVAEGRLCDPQRPSWRATLSLMARLGLRRLGALARQPWISMPVLNPVGDVLRHNGAAQTHTKAARSVLRDFDAGRDSLVIHEPRYRALGFRPQFWQAMEGFKFVYLAP